MRPGFEPRYRAWKRSELAFWCGGVPFYLLSFSTDPRPIENRRRSEAMGCVLRAYGRRFDVDRYLARSPFRPCSVRRRGEPVAALSQPKGRKCIHSGCNIDVSKRDFADLKGQILDAICFLRRYGPAIRALRRFPGVEWARLDFGVDWLDVVYQCDVLPQELVVLAGRCQLGLEISHYPVARGGSNAKRTVGKRERSHGALYRKQRQEVKEAYAEFCAHEAKSKRASRSSSTTRKAPGKTTHRRSR
jgi:hypothetical protein